MIWSLLTLDLQQCSIDPGKIVVYRITKVGYIDPFRNLDINICCSIHVLDVSYPSCFGFSMHVFLLDSLDLLYWSHGAFCSVLFRNFSSIASSSSVEPTYQLHINWIMRIKTVSDTTE